MADRRRGLGGSAVPSIPAFECYLLRGGGMTKSTTVRAGAKPSRALALGATTGTAHSAGVGGRSQISRAYLVWIAQTISSNLLFSISPASTKDLPTSARYLGRLFEGNRLHLWRCGSIAAMDLKKPIVNYVSWSEAPRRKAGDTPKYPRDGAAIRIHCFRHNRRVQE